MALSLDDSVKAKLKRWTVFLISPVVWMSYFMVLYAFDETVCALDILRSVVWGEVTAAALIMLVLTAATLGVTGFTIYLGGRMVRESGQRDDGAAERDRFIGVSAMTLGGLFAVITVGMAAVIVVLNLC